MDELQQAREILDVEEPDFMLAAIDWLTRKGYTVSFDQDDMIDRRHIWAVNGYSKRVGRKPVMAGCMGHQTPGPPFEHLLAEVVVEVHKQENPP